MPEAKQVCILESFLARCITCVCTNICICAYIYTRTHMCARTHTQFRPLRNLVSVKGAHMDSLWLQIQGCIFRSLKTTIHSFEAEVLGSISKTGRRSVTMRTDRSGEHGFQNWGTLPNHTTQTSVYLIHEESEDIHQKCATNQLKNIFYSSIT